MRDVIFATLLAGFLTVAPAWSQDNGGNNDNGNNSGNNNGDSGGQPLDGDVRDKMESAFGTDFSDVRNHGDNESATMSENSGAQAYTHGGDLYLNNAETTGGERGGRVLIAHELAHVLQQQGQQSTATETDETESEEKGEPDPRVERRQASEERRQRRPERRIPD